MRKDEGGDGKGAITLVCRLGEVQAAGDDAVVVSGDGNGTAFHIPDAGRENKITADAGDQ